MRLLRLALPLLAALLSISAVSAQETLEFDPTVCAEHQDGGALSADCAAMIATYPTPPNLTPVDQDRFTLGAYNFWRVSRDGAPRYDAPGGSVIGGIPAGFNTVHGIDAGVEGWLQIADGSWIPRDLTTFQQPSYFTGYEIADGLEHPFAVILDLSRIFVSLYPGGPRSSSNGRFINRYELVNIYSTAVDADGWRWYMIGPNQWIEQRFVSKFFRIERPEGIAPDAKWVSVDLYEQTLVAYEGDMPVYATVVSTGLPPNETNEGLFNIWASLPLDRMSGATGAPDAYAVESVPWVMYFDGGISLHGTYWHDLFGYRQSHGCVNLTISDARWLYGWVHDGDFNGMGEADVQVYVHSSGEYGVTATGI
ncbi:MAG: L,D-transpeptidase [Anaerolineae bacterium]|nr:L,D-transpeptidase [Anaerolineae bacterium]NUQ07099.1 L,D-transpeptidase [Anaerolineae bacterium]